MSAVHDAVRPPPTVLSAPPTKVHLLHPGDVALGTRGERFETLLGSCVAIVLTDPRRTLGVMCHIVHSSAPVKGATASAAYADQALDEMFGLLVAQGINPTMCVAYVYGGGNMFPARVAGHHVGQANQRWAFDTLADCGIHVVDADVGGNTYRRLSWTVGPQAPTVVAVPV